ncbi:hypothetical protein A9Q78_01670 [Methylophaga sp. 41_12_T18]|nr:hypothetical protein A9Q78_01670 [Methylophaga sp. 41_12_T18]
MKQIITSVLILLVFPTLSYAAVIKFVTGDELTVKIIEKTASYLKVNHEVLGELTIENKNVLTIQDSTQVQMSVTETKEQTIDKDDGLFGMGLLADWQRNFTLGLNGQQSNSDSLDLHTAFAADYDNDDKRWNFGFHYNFSQEDGKSTHDDINIYLNRDWLMPDTHWLYFATVKYDWDKFKSWDYRLTAIAGVGYEFIEQQNFSLIGRSGIAGKKNFGSDEDEFEPELMLGLESTWAISRIQSLSFKTEFFSPFEHASDIRNLSKLDWKFKLDSKMDLSFKLGLENEYESVVAVDSKHNDFKYRAAIVWGL